MKPSLILISFLTLSSGPLALATGFDVVYDHSKGTYAVLKSDDHRCQGKDVAGGFIGSPETDDIWHIKDLCGISQVDFYKRADNHFDGYMANGDGVAHAWCRANGGTGDLTCNSFECTDSPHPQCHAAVWHVDEKIVCFVNNDWCN